MIHTPGQEVRQWLRRDVMICMSKFRNVIVHDYARIDPTIVAQILREHLEDFTWFKAAALKWI